MHKLFVLLFGGMLSAWGIHALGEDTNAGSELLLAVRNLKSNQILVGWRPFVKRSCESKEPFVLDTNKLFGEEGHLVLAAGKKAFEYQNFLTFNTLGKSNLQDVANTFLGGTLEPGWDVLNEPFIHEQMIFNSIEAEAATHGTPVRWRIYQIHDCGCTHEDLSGVAMVTRIRSEIIALNRGFAQYEEGGYVHHDAEALRIRDSYGYCVSGSKNGKNHNCASVFLHLVAHVAGHHRCHALDRFQGDQIGYTIGTAICAAGAAVAGAPMLAADNDEEEDQDARERCEGAQELAPVCWLVGGTLLGVGALINFGTAVIDLTFGVRELLPLQVYQRRLSKEFGWDSHKLGCYLNPQCWELISETHRTRPTEHHTDS
ncbi:MAG: hypothetical protein OXT67_02295 [Zetaproteobacteria bacterium]|nr:hypothetical protein [Zetaproteobacteria bacterium]